jgi:hypothetical protein
VVPQKKIIRVSNGLEIVTLDLRAEAAHHEGVDVGGRATHAHDAAATPRSGCHHTLRRRFDHRDQQPIWWTE